MRAGFAYYRAIPQSIEQNAKHALTTLKMPVLTIDGQYARGLALKSMLEPVAINVSASEVPDAGHYPQEEAPDAMLKVLLSFLTEK